MADRKILVIVPYEFYPPKSGGALRCYHVIREFAKYFKVAVATSQYIDTTDKESRTIFQNVEFYFTGSNATRYGLLKYIIPRRLLNYIFFRFLFHGKNKESVNSMFVDFYPAIRLALKKFSPEVVIFENLESLYYLNEIVRKFDPKIKIVYEAHNVDHILWKKLAGVNNDKDLLKYSGNALAVESALSRYTDCVVCVTKQDELVLKKLNQGNHIVFTTVASGVDTASKVPSSNALDEETTKILFCGSLNYLPNSEGIKWFYINVMPWLRKKLNDFTIVIIGNAENLDEYAYLNGDPQVQLIGRVDDVTPYYHTSHLSIVPLLSGSGIRLKIMESMSYGCPVVSTTLGAEGIDYDEDSILIADDPERFADGIVTLSRSNELRRKLGKNGRQLAESKYDWRMLMNEFKNVIKNLN